MSFLLFMPVISLQTLYPLRRFFSYLPYPIMVSLYEKLRNAVYY